MSTNLDPKTTPTTPLPPDTTPEAPTTRLTDEQQAVNSLDDTAMQPMPSSTALWEAVEDARQPAAAPEKQARKFRVRTGALVAAVAVVSFVAGGAFTRLSSQVPLLFSEKPTSTESVASYVEPEQPAPEPEQTEAEPVAPEPEEDYSLNDTQPTTDDQTYDDYTWRWNLDSDGNDRITYNNTDDLVTIDYNGYSLTVPIGELMGYDEQSYPTGNGYNSQSPSTRDRSYGYTNDYDGYDTYNDYGWNSGRPDSYGWYGYSA